MNTSGCYLSTLGQKQSRERQGWRGGNFVEEVFKGMLAEDLNDGEKKNRRGRNIGKPAD